MRILAKSEFKFILLVSLILIVISTLPFVYGHLIRGDYYYTGEVFLSAGDGTVYLSFIDQVKSGHWLFDNLFTNEKTNLRVFNPFWLLVGLIARVFNLAPIIAFSLFRIILIPILVVILYKFISIFLQSSSLLHKKICLLLTLLGSGIGRYVLLFWPLTASNNSLVQKPMDLWSTGTFNFLQLFGSPHLIASTCLKLLIFYYLFRGFEENKLKYSILSGFFALLLFSFHPFHVLTFYIVPLIYLIILAIKNIQTLSKNISKYLIYVLISLPGPLYYAYLNFNYPEFKIKALQNFCTTPQILSFLASYGFLLVFSIVGISFLLNEKKFNNKYIFLTTWATCSIFLVYSPVSWQNRLAEGLQIPLSILALIGLVAIYNLLKVRMPLNNLTKTRTLLLVLLMIYFFGSTNIYKYVQLFDYLQAKPSDVYLPEEFKTAIGWYKNNVTEEKTILSSVKNGNILPGQSGRRVYVGHNVETLNFLEKYKKANWFFKENNEDELKKVFLRDNDIDYVLYSDLEKSMGFFHPEEKEYLKVFYNNSTVTIYQVNL